MSEENTVFECPKLKDGCTCSYQNFNDLLAHVQNECLYFGSKYYPLLPKSIKNPESYPTPNITKYIMKNEEPVLEEIPEMVFVNYTQPQKNRILKKSEKQIKAGPQRFIKEKDIPSTEHLEISKCMLKSNLFCVMKLFGKKMRYLIAYATENFEICIKDIVDFNVNPIVIKAHKDIITEIKFHKIGNEDMISSCSYDNFFKLWKTSNWENYLSINFGSWVTSMTLLNDKFKLGQQYICLCGGFNANYPVKIYDIEGQLSGEVKIKEGFTSNSIYNFHDELNQRSYLFVSCENEKGSAILMFDFHVKSILRQFPSEKYCTKIEFNVDNSNTIIITYVDFKGQLKQFNVENGKLIKQINLGTNCFDLISYDEEYFICCGDYNDHSFKVIYKDGLQVVKTYSQAHNNVILNLAFIEHPTYGKCLLTLGADKKISIFKK